jgi:hypothetical protein
VLLRGVLFLIYRKEHLLFLSFFFFFSVLGVELSRKPTFSFQFVFQMGSRIFAQGWPQTLILLSPLELALIIVVYHHTQPCMFFLLKIKSA